MVVVVGTEWVEDGRLDVVGRADGLVIPGNGGGPISDTILVP